MTKDGLKYSILPATIKQKTSTDLLELPFVAAPRQALISQKLPHLICHVVPCYKIPHPGETPRKNSH